MQRGGRGCGAAEWDGEAVTTDGSKIKREEEKRNAEKEEKFDDDKSHQKRKWCELNKRFRRWLLGGACGAAENMQIIRFAFRI